MRHKKIIYRIWHIEPLHDRVNHTLLRSTPETETQTETRIGAKKTPDHTPPKRPRRTLDAEEKKKREKRAAMFTTQDFSRSTHISLGLGDDRLRLEATKAFNLAFSRGQLGRFWAKILRRSNNLQTLPSLPISTHRPTSRIVSVSICQIKGTLGRSTDFDADFNPLDERTRSRWVSVATAVRKRIPLPPVELVQVGDTFYVRDGHHRISVARTFGQEAIEARIVN